MRYQQLSRGERYIIAFCLKRGESKSAIAKMIGRHPSTIYREVQRNWTRHDGWYRAWIADGYAVARRHRGPKGSGFNEAEWGLVKALLERKLSPEQVSGLLREQGILLISHETIYQYIFEDRRRGGKLYKNLRTKIRKHRKRGAKQHRRITYADRTMISERPESVERRSRIGHWEGDTVYGADRRHSIVTLVERKTGLAIIKKIEARTIAETNRVILEAVREHPWKFRSITFDNGFEFMGYRELEEKAKIKCYFANPYHSWERGSNENLNGLIRQYLPKGSCMRQVSQADCDWISEELNSRPRKRHGYRTPKELFYAN
jgi:IS30 family transposase